MSVTFQERPNYSPEQVSEHVGDAIRLVEEIDPPADLRAAVFQAACQLYAAKQILTVQAPPLDLAALARRPNHDLRG